MINHHTINSPQRLQGSRISEELEDDRYQEQGYCKKIKTGQRLQAIKSKSASVFIETKMMPTELDRKFKRKKHREDNNKMTNHIYLLITTIIISITTLLPIATNCDDICPKDTSFIYPCTCNNGTRGLLIKCSRLNLATFSNSIKYLNNEFVDQIELESASISRLFGPLFSDSETYKFHKTIRELDVRNSKLETIEQNSFSQELKYNLQYLALDRNLLQQVPIELVNNMTNLKLLNFSSNSIAAIEANSFTKLSNLTELDLSQNKIWKLNKMAFNNLYQLEWLSLANNELQGKLEKNLFAFGRKLKHLDMSGNKLSTLDRQDFNDLTTLETLILANNQLTTIPRSIFSRNGKLYNLDLSNNKLEDIDTYLFKSVRFLRDLNVSGNLIKEITKNTFSPTTRIKRIDMSQNLLTALVPETFKNLEWLERLNLSHNQIVNISNNAFDKIYSVEIDLSHNKLQRIFYWAFNELSNITKLDLSHNLIDEGVSQIAFHETDCAHLDLSYNLIQDISKVPISNFTGIKILDLSHNQITEFNKKSFAQKTPLYELHTVDASYNNISQISGNILERLKSVRLLNLTHNSLRRLTSSSLGQSPTLLELDLSHNNLVDFGSGTLVGLVSMRNLDVRYNKLKKMIPIPVALNSIHLEYNEIGQLSKSAFPSLNSLLELYLDNNRISHIEEGTFATLLALHTLSLSNNNLSLVPAQALKDLASLQLLRLDGNNIQKLDRRAFGTLPIVFDLFLDRNNISHIADQAFDGMLQLLSLNLSSNHLTELPPAAFFGLVSLRKLDLSNNHINRFENKTHSAMDDLLSLEVANFSSNKLSMITGKTFISSQYIPYKLTHLDLSNNLIGIIMNNFANGFKRLEWLSLRNNIINEIYPNVLGNASYLRHLDLSHNKLRTLKEGTLNGKFVNLTTILLNNNKLTSVPAKEFESQQKFRSLTQLDLSSNRLDSFDPDTIQRLVRHQGVSLNLKQNNLHCSCQLLPLVAWADEVKFRNQSYTLVSGGANLMAATFGGTGGNNNRLATRPATTASHFERYLQAANVISEVNCTKPDVLSGKSIMSLIDLAPTMELSCDLQLQEEADQMKTLKAPIQFYGVEPYFVNGEQNLKIGWSLVDLQLNFLNFIVMRLTFESKFSLAFYRSSLSSSPLSSRLSQEMPMDNRNNNYQLLEHEIHRMPYTERTLILRNLNPSKYHVVCVLYENEWQLMNKMIDQQYNITSSSLANKLPTIFADYTRINCVDLNSLARQNNQNGQDSSDRLISGAGFSLKQISMVPLVLIVLTFELSILFQQSIYLKRFFSPQ